MAWNGGVSLAIWMGGVAVELDTARRAHLGPQTGEGNERSLYHALTRVFDRKLVIDILAGASAGGINGALLGAVITKQRELRPNFVRERWLELGDLSSLLRPINESKPESLLQGELFRDAMRKAFRAVTGEDDDEQTRPSHPDLPAGEVLLDVQATNVMGTERGFSDEWHQTLYAREYRAPIRFRRPADYSSDALAAAARASASFPAAFEPSALMSKSAQLAGFTGLKRWAIDGGLLENAPIKPAIELIPTRHAESPVTRFVCYVNAAPTNPELDPDPEPLRPELREVLADVINLPRDGRFIDQLTAIEDAVERTAGVKEAATGLLGLDGDALHATATALFDAYRQPRTRGSLREILSAATDGGQVAKMIDDIVERLGGAQLPWMPATLSPPTQASEWRWGLRPAQRILLLQLDLLRAMAEDENPVERARLMDELLEYRRPLNNALARLEDARGRFSSSPPIQSAAARLAASATRADASFYEHLEELDSLMVGFRCEAYDAVRLGTKTLYEALAKHPPPPTVSKKGLFGRTRGRAFGDDHLRHFLERALAIEVVRRAFAPDRDLEPTQDLHFVQMTPRAAARVFTDSPLHEEGPNSGDVKLTGLALAHFSAFYRRSWRANDFMWGRLDGATRIVDLLVSPRRAGQIGLIEEGPNGRLGDLANELVPEGHHVEARERRQLVKEALDDMGCQAPVDRDDVEGLRHDLLNALAADLEDAKGDGFFTRVVCARAAHYEILRQELQPLAEATARDGKLGCFSEPIPYDPQGGALASARALVQNGPLPARLGSGVPDESTSTLAVRTLSHAVLVSLSALKTAGVPFGRTLGIIRAPFLSLAGITAEKIYYRATALLAFVAASFYITARVVRAQNAEANLNEAWSSSTLATLVAIFAALGLVALPAWRAVRARRWARKVRQGAWATAMFLVSGLAALVAGSFYVGVGNAVTSTDGFSLPTTLAVAVIVAPLGASAVMRLVRLPSIGPQLLTKLMSRMIVTALATAVVAGALVYESFGELRDVVSLDTALTGWLDGDNWRALFGSLDSWSELTKAIKRNWQEMAVIATYASVPLAALYGLHGFVRAGIDFLRVRASRVLR